MNAIHVMSYNKCIHTSSTSFCSLVKTTNFKWPHRLDPLLNSINICKFYGLCPYQPGTQRLTVLDFLLFMLTNYSSSGWMFKVDFLLEGNPQPSLKSYAASNRFPSSIDQFIILPSALTSFTGPDEERAFI
ncbi:hypothetical protein ATANTOWER_008274 [Ataeniobius toweri]|uniref:Uncharacterized protein n=1 Tax=Ataeniobius toweri TaxID=208326 RepID=A0ABU7AIQ5_9TELE|nr:hypothetical protein [Ataeniobius toweri]